MYYFFSMVYLRSSKTDTDMIPSTKHSLINGIPILCLSACILFYMSAIPLPLYCPSINLLFPYGIRF